MPQASTYDTDTADATDFLLGVTAGGVVKRYDIGEFALLGVEEQVLAGGARVTSKSLSTGNITIDCGDRPIQHITNGGAFTLTAPANDGSCMLLVTNNGSAGAITFSGFDVGSSTGDALTTTDGHLFTISIWRINGTAGYRIAAHQ
jgi:hypothetical protein